MIVGLPLAVERREQAMGEFTAKFARLLPTELKPLAFCSTASFREPEIDNCWHPYFINRKIFFLFINEFWPLLRSGLGGIKRVALARFGKFIYLPNQSAQILAITPASICKFQNNQVKTNYCDPSDIEKMNWLVFYESGKEKDYIPRLRAFRLFLNLMNSWLRVSLNKRDKDWTTASLLTLRWIIGFQWMIMLTLSKKVSSIIETQKPKKIFCVHELLPWARIVWHEAKLAGVPTITIQHASITRTKLWYFPTQMELVAGLATPDEFLVYSEKEINLLKPYYPSDIIFHLGCGPRFAHWKDKILIKREAADIGAPILFVSSVPWWDNEVILQGVRRLLNDPALKRQIIVRFHPLAVIPKKWLPWLWLMKKLGKIQVSKDFLENDVLKSGIVVGMNSTVLEEAVAMERSILVIDDPAYLNFATPIVERINLADLNEKNVEKNIVNFDNNLRQRAINSLALNQPVFIID